MVGNNHDQMQEHHAADSCCCCCPEGEADGHAPIEARSSGINQFARPSPCASEGPTSAAPSPGGGGNEGGH